jgi:hypothetical protein
MHAMTAVFIALPRERLVSYEAHDTGLREIGNREDAGPGSMLRK